jgi:spore maturation protein CgeB
MRAKMDFIALVAENKYFSGNEERTMLFTKKMERFLVGLARGFFAKGLNVKILIGKLPPEKLYKFCEEENPSAILEVNRSRNLLPDLPKKIKHIAWWQDEHVEEFQEGSGSDLNYCVAEFEKFGAKKKEGLFYDILHFGVDEKTFYPSQTKQEFLSDFSLAGYISPPIEKGIEKTSIVTSEKKIPYLEIVKAFLGRYKGGLRNWDKTTINEIVYDILSEKVNWNRNHPIPQEILCDFQSQYPRFMERKELIDGILNFSRSLRLFGEKSWSSWQEYEPYYQGFLATSEQLWNMYQTTKINLHNGSPILHPRALECMASGGFLAAIESSKAWPESFHDFFEEGKHYVTYNFDNLEEKAKYYLEHPERRSKIGHQASEFVLAKHTWRHRAEKILNDLKQI